MKNKNSKKMMKEFLDLEKELKVRVKYFINKRTNQISMTVQKKNSKEFINYLPNMKKLKFLDLRLKRNGKY